MYRGTKQNDSLSDEIGCIFIRGVGEAMPNESMLKAMPFLRRHDIKEDSIAEVNWSWSDKIEWPYHSTEKYKASIPRTKFLRELGYAFQNVAGCSLPSHTKWAKFIQRIVTLSLIPSQAFIAIAPVFLLLVWFGPSHLISYFILSAIVAMITPVMIACLSLESGLIWATIRSGFMRIFWPFLYLSLLISVFGIPAVVYILIFSIGPAVVEALVPLHHKYINVGTAEERIFQSTHLFELIQNIALMISGYIGFSIALFTCYFVIRRLKTALKISADICRYLGDKEYRDDIIEQLAKKIDQLVQNGYERIFLLSHSLGSVIAVDTLRTYNYHLPHSIVLVTSGSPLRRFFWRFFRSEYPSPADIYSTLILNFNEKGTNFDWINIYRSLDPVGTSLRLSQKHERCISNKRGNSIFSDHINYWGDEQIYLSIIDCLKQEV